MAEIPEVGILLFKILPMTSAPSNNLIERTYSLYQLVLFHEFWGYILEFHLVFGEVLNKFILIQNSYFTWKYFGHTLHN